MFTASSSDGCVQFSYIRLFKHGKDITGKNCQMEPCSPKVL